MRGHFNRLDAYYCEICGLGMVQQTRVVVTGPRPSLGVLVLDDGTSYALDTDYLVGRSPGSPDETRRSRRAAPQNRRHPCLAPTCPHQS